MIGFPAPWRDLFRKSGRTLEAELARTGAALEPAEPARYEFADGSAMDLPTDRGDQFVALRRPTARARPSTGGTCSTGWTTSGRRCGPSGLEAELTDPAQLSAAVRRLLQPAADGGRAWPSGCAHPDLAALIRASAYRMGSLPDRTPAWAAVALSVERRFGRWTVTAPTPDARARVGRTSTLIEALADRLAVRKVDVQPRPAGHESWSRPARSSSVRVRPTGPRATFPR